MNANSIVITNQVGLKNASWSSSKKVLRRMAAPLIEGKVGSLLHFGSPSNTLGRFRPDQSGTLVGEGQGLDTMGEGQLVLLNGLPDIPELRRADDDAGVSVFRERPLDFSREFLDIHRNPYEKRTGRLCGTQVPPLDLGLLVLAPVCDLLPNFADAIHRQFGEVGVFLHHQPHRENHVHVAGVATPTIVVVGERTRIVSHSVNRVPAEATLRSNHPLSRVRSKGGVAGCAAVAPSHYPRCGLVQENLNLARLVLLLRCRLVGRERQLIGVSAIPVVPRAGVHRASRVAVGCVGEEPVGDFPVRRVRQFHQNRVVRAGGQRGLDVVRVVGGPRELSRGVRFPHHDDVGGRVDLLAFHRVPHVVAGDERGGNVPRAENVGRVVSPDAGVAPHDEAQSRDHEKEPHETYSLKRNARGLYCIPQRRPRNSLLGLGTVGLPQHVQPVTPNHQVVDEGASRRAGEEPVPEMGVSHGFLSRVSGFRPFGLLRISSPTLRRTTFRRDAIPAIVSVPFETPLCRADKPRVEEFVCRSFRSTPIGIGSMPYFPTSLPYFPSIGGPSHYETRQGVGGRAS